MARNARIHGVLIYLWIHSTLLFVRFLTESISFKAKKKHQSVINFLSIPVFILMLRISYILGLYIKNPKIFRKYINNLQS